MSLAFDMIQGLKEIQGRIDEAVHSFARDRGYRAEFPLRENGLCLGYTMHGCYPVRMYWDETRFTCVDGFIYGKDEKDVEAELADIRERALSGDASFKECISRWTLSTDGEYVVILGDTESGNILCFNDTLSRLPLYYLIEGGRLLLSREAPFIRKVKESAGFDREAIFEYLLFGYALSGKTLFEGVKRLAGGSLIYTRGKEGSVSVERVSEFNFEAKRSTPGGIGRVAAEIAELMHEACRKRQDPSLGNVVALSGGLDSRTVAACLKNESVPFTAATFKDHYGIVGPDVAIAKKMADELDVRWDLYEMRKAKGRDCLELLRQQCGMNYLGLSFAVPLIKNILREHPEGVTLLTGDGGDRVLRDTRPVGNIRSLDTLVQYIIEHNSMIDIRAVSEMTMIDEGLVKERLRDILLEYEEKDMKMKYLQFVFSERCPGWHFQGEERNRFYLRPVTPFYSIELFRRSMSIKDEMKKDFRLYREVLSIISPKLASIENAEWGFPITSWKLPLYCRARRAYFSMPSNVKKVIESRLRRGRMRNAYGSRSNVMECIRKQISGKGPVAEYLSVESVEANIQRIDKLGFDHLFTLTSVLEEEGGGESSIGQYMEDELI